MYIECYIVKSEYRPNGPGVEIPIIICIFVIDIYITHVTIINKLLTYHNDLYHSIVLI
jgi:hypothetical protein